MTKYRCYHFQNFYLQGIHAGVQSEHSAVEMFVKYYDADNSTVNTLWNWARNHKTVIVLNGGMAKDILNLETMLNESSMSFPWAPFYEDEAALNGCITNVGIVLPDYIYEPARFIANPYRPSDQSFNRLMVMGSGSYELTFANDNVSFTRRVYSADEVAFMKILASCRLMS